MYIQKLLRSRLLTRILVVSSLVTAGTMVTTIAKATTWSNNEVAVQLWGIASMLNLDNVDLSDVEIDNLYRNRIHNISLNLSAGTTHYLVGVCDSDCDDMDLALYDENDNLISRDIAPDAFPSVRVSPRWNGRYTLRVSMPNCSTNYCSYGVGLFN